MRLKAISGLDGKMLYQPAVSVMSDGEIETLKTSQPVLIQGDQSGRDLRQGSRSVLALVSGMLLLCNRPFQMEVAQSNNHVLMAINLNKVFGRQLIAFPNGAKGEDLTGTGGAKMVSHSTSRTLVGEVGMAGDWLGTPLQQGCQMFLHGGSGL